MVRMVRMVRMARMARMAAAKDALGVLSEVVVPGVLLDAADEVDHRLAPPVAGEPVRSLRPIGDQLHEAADGRAGEQADGCGRVGWGWLYVRLRADRQAGVLSGGWAGEWKVTCAEGGTAHDSGAGRARVVVRTCTCARPWRA